MKAVKIKEGIYWVGAIDWNVRNFHGYMTKRGSTYGAYLIMDEKITLIDTVKEPFSSELLQRISSITDPSSIDIMVSNHVEMDHSGALPVMRSLCPHAAIYTSGPSGVKGLTAHYGAGDYIPVKSGDTISLGRRSLTFISTPMLHWPDNMVTYCPEEKILFSNDAFGQHLATSERFDDEAELYAAMDEAKRYYANIIMCYGKQARTAWDTVRELQPDILAPSHGIVWRSHVKDILQCYDLWSLNDPTSGALVVYDSMWHSTEKMAQVIAAGFADAGMHTKLYDLKANHPSDILPDLLNCRYLAVGSPTLNNQMLPTVAGFLCYLKGLTPGNREAFAFGSFGWGGQSVALVEAELQSCGFRLCLEGIRIPYVPSAEQLHEIYEKVQTVIKSIGKECYQKG